MTSEPRISERQLRLLDLADDIDPSNDDSNWGVYSSRLMAQLSLPHKDPGEVPEWTRRNNALSLTINPGIIRTPEGTKRAYPYGVIPRYLMTWMTTEAIRTQSRELHLGRSLRSFMHDVGLHSGGRDGKRLLDQLHRLSVASINVEDLRNTKDRWTISGANFHIASRYQLTFSNTSDRDDVPGSAITLSEEFYDNALKHPVRLRPEVLKALSRSPMRLDMYTWLMYRIAGVTRPTTVTWRQLSMQFGAEYAQQRQFKAAFRRHLKEVQLFLPHADKTLVVLPETGIRLKPLPTRRSIAS